MCANVCVGDGAVIMHVFVNECAVGSECRKVAGFYEGMCLLINYSLPYTLIFIYVHIYI